jgi:NADPH:quinone reductase-like Zn-dependent oxidoreductase
MKAAVHRRFGAPEVITVQEVAAPEPQAGEVLIRVGAATVGVVDGLARRGAPFYARVQFGLRRPRFPVLGSDFAGQVAAVGPGVTGFAAGDDVFGTTAPRFGAHAEYIVLSAQAALAPMPAGLSYAGAAALADTTALCFLRDQARLSAGQDIVINGASGAVGTSAVQLARHYGARVTAVCGGAGAGLVRRLGAAEVVDYARADFARAGHAYDVIFDVAGTSSFARCRAALRPGGTYLTTAPSLALAVQVPWTSRFGGKTARIALTGLRPAADKRRDLACLRELAEASAIVPVIEDSYPLARIADAHRRVDAGHKQGYVVVTMTGAP